MERRPCHVGSPLFRSNFWVNDSHLTAQDIQPSLKLTATLHLKTDGWNISFLLGPGLFSEAKICQSYNRQPFDRKIHPETRALDLTLEEDDGRSNLSKLSNE